MVFHRTLYVLEPIHPSFPQFAQDIFHMFVKKLLKTRSFKDPFPSLVEFSSVLHHFPPVFHRQVCKRVLGFGTFPQFPQALMRLLLNN
jgi:hypothetical protein